MDMTPDQSYNSRPTWAVWMSLTQGVQSVSWQWRNSSLALPFLIRHQNRDCCDSAKNTLSQIQTKKPSSHKRYRCCSSDSFSGSCLCMCVSFALALTLLALLVMPKRRLQLLCNSRVVIFCESGQFFFQATPKSNSVQQPSQFYGLKPRWHW